ncbi:MAG: GPP34 family phosphoprotein [Bacteroidales bacterium]|jgi:hypothetical protein|nr:GPP34 family phosphoprotein [Bacteroidales bacterium]
MELNLIQKFILLAIDPKTGKLLIDSLSLNYGIAGSILLEMSEINKITIKNKRIIVSDTKLTNNSIIDECVNLISRSRKPRKAKFWINKIGNRANRFKKEILADLNVKRIVIIKQKTFLWGLISLKRYPSSNIKIITDLKQKLKGIVLENQKTDIDGLMILSLMNSCKLSHVLFANKKEYRKSNKRIKELVREVEISNDVGLAIKEIQAAVLIATTSSFIGSSSV